MVNLKFVEKIETRVTVIPSPTQFIGARNLLFIQPITKNKQILRSVQNDESPLRYMQRTPDYARLNRDLASLQNGNAATKIYIIECYFTCQ